MTARYDPAVWTYPTGQQLAGLMTPFVDERIQGKTQWIRVADVLLVGPLMIAGGVALHPKSVLAGWALGLFGVGTIILNGYNLLRFENA